MFDGEIRTVQLFRDGQEASFPAISLKEQNSTQLLLQFDRLGNDVPEYTVHYRHCNSDWTPSNLPEIEYLKGMSGNPIRDFQSSLGTLNPYVHFEWRFPEQGLRFQFSGNYIIEVRDRNTGEPVLWRKFVVFEDAMDVSPDLQFAASVRNRWRFQQVNFNVLPKSERVDNPRTQLKVAVLQNFRWDNARVFEAPEYVYPNRFEYVLDAQNEFSGGNEFRLADLRGTRTQISPRVAGVSFANDGTTLYLEPDQPRTFNNYFSENDFNGQFYIRSRMSDRFDVEADYVYTHFRLQMSEPLAQEAVYVFGALSNWRAEPRFQMTWRSDKNWYEARVLLKQGVYDYQYVVQQSDGSLDETRLEGSHAETENFYSFIVYYKGMMDRYERCVAVKHLNFYRQ